MGLVWRGGWGSRIDRCSWCIMESSNTRKDGVAVCTGYLPSKNIQFNYNRISHSTIIWRVTANTWLFLNASLPISGYYKSLKVLCVFSCRKVKQKIYIKWESFLWQLIWPLYVCWGLMNVKFVKFLISVSFCFQFSIITHSFLKYVLIICLWVRAFSYEIIFTYWSFIDILMHLIT